MAIWEFAHNSEFLKKVKEEFGNYLFERKYYEEAGMMFKQAGENQKAIDSFMETNNYHLLFTTFAEQKLSQDEIAKAIETYVTKLEAKKNWKEIGEIYLTYTE